MGWMFFSILAAMTWAVVNISDKYVLSRLVSSPLIPVIFLGLTGLLASIIIYLSRGFDPLSFSHILLAFLSGILSLLMVFFYFKATQIEEISRVVPLWYLAPLFVLLLAGPTLGEVLQPLTYLGVFLLVGGAMLVSVKDPFLITLGKPFWLMILSALALALNQVTTKYLLNFADFWTVFAYGRICLFLVLAPIIYLNVSKLIETYQQGGVRTLGIITINELLNIGAVLSMTVAASTGLITLVNALASVQALFVLLFATFVSIFYPGILKEETGMRTISLKLVAVGMMFIGALLIH